MNLYRIVLFPSDFDVETYWKTFVLLLDVCMTIVSLMYIYL